MEITKLWACLLIAAAAAVPARADDDELDDVAAPPDRVVSATMTRRTTSVPGGAFTTGVSPTPPGADAVHLALPEAVRLSLLRNKTLSVRKLDPSIAAARVMQERGAFDHVYTLDTQTQHRETPTGSQLEGAQTSVTDTELANMGIARTYKGGQRVAGRFTNQRFETNSRFANLNPQWTSNLIVNATQPLVRGAGYHINTANLRVAQNGVRQGQLRLDKVVLDTVSAVERQYWDLVFFRQDRDVKRFALQAAEELLAFNIRRQQVGVGSEVEVIEARATAAARSEDLEVSNRQLSDAEEILRRLTGLDDHPPGTEIYPEDQMPVLPPPVSLPGALAAAYDKRPDYRDLLIEMKNQKINVQFLKNQTLPKVDLVASYAQNGLAGTYAQALDQVGDAGFQSYTVGVQLEVPFENRAAKGAYHVGRLQKRQALLNVRALEDQIEEEVARAVRSLNTDRRRVEVARQGQDLSGQQLRAAEARYREGLIPNIDLLRFQQDLAAARTRFLRAVVDLVKDGINLEAAMGVLLDTRSICVDRLPIPPDQEIPPGHDELVDTPRRRH